MKKNHVLSVPVLVLGLLGVLPFGSTSAFAAAPQGVLKQAIHWGLPADWNDPATVGHTTGAQATLYLFHDALLKPMPEGTYTPFLGGILQHQPGCQGL